MKRYRLTSAHAEDIGTGALPEPGEEFDADPSSDAMVRLLAEGKAVELPGLVPPSATEAAERRAEELGVDLGNVEGTGAKNKVTVDDVEKAADAGDDDNNSEED